MTSGWPAGSVIEAVEDIVLDDFDHQGNRTVILEGARAEVLQDNLSLPPTDDGFVRFPTSKVKHWIGSTIFNASYLWRWRGSFKVVGEREPKGFV